MPGPKQPAGVTLVEVAVSTALVGLVLVAALETLGGAMRTLRQTADEVRAHTLAETLLAEVIALPYSDPENGETTLGLESDETLSADSRALFDDLDDFNGWLQSPPEYRSGAAIPGYGGWTRKVEVTYLGAEPSAGQLAHNIRDEGLKRILVSVIDPDGTVTELYAIRSPYGPNEAPAPFDATRVGTMRVEIEVGGGETIRKAVGLTNLAEDPNP